MSEDEDLMSLALREAGEAAKEGEIPVGAILVKDKEVLARDHNRTIFLNDPSAHAEILVLRKAGEKLKNYRLPGTTLYVTLEPCLMCAGAMIQARIEHLVYGTPDPKAGAVTSVYCIFADKKLNHTVRVTRGVLEKDCRALLQGFFKYRR
ncbi:MAG: tRNA adenosine(34) deaminase TadA [Deltaproteobacteria bacterium]|nr:MAG: tRNA adenosine(34) deaminase TadA [Deltaproteobacteria bacterium]